MKIRPVGTELLHADRRTDTHDEANSRFSQYGERAQKYVHTVSWMYNFLMLNLVVHKETHSL